jgi:AAA domain/Bifunctional DNA primase/polymerase, N-terminal
MRWRGVVMPDVTALPAALHDCRLIPLKPGTKVPAVRHATFDVARPWDASVDAHLAGGGRVGVMMGEQLVGLDADLKMIYQDADDGSGAQVVVEKNGLDDITWLMQKAGLTELPRTLKVRTQGGGQHLVFRQCPDLRVTQRTIGCLDVRAARNSYLAIGAGYEILDDGDGVLAELPAPLAAAIMSMPHTPVNGKDAVDDGSPAYGSMQTAFNNALLSAKGYLVKLGWPEEQATEAVRRLNSVSDDPMDEARFETTVGREKGYEPGEMITDSMVQWAEQQLSVSALDPRVDIQTVKRLWTTDQYRKSQKLLALEPPQRKKLREVFEAEKPRWVLAGLMTAGVYGLAGPPEAGKSLLARDWMLAVANGTSWQRLYRGRPRDVTYVISEGHHDLDERFPAGGIDRISIFTEPVMLTDDDAVDDFIVQHDGLDTGMVVFDIVYDMGMADDNGTKDVAPVISAARKISHALDCAVLLLGHPGHNGIRRFRGSSMWRGRFDGEFHLAEGQLSCEKHKYADKLAMQWPYEIRWPELHYLTDGEEIGRDNQYTIIRAAIRDHPDETDYALARILADSLGVSVRTLQRRIKEIRPS